MKHQEAAEHVGDWVAEYYPGVSPRPGRIVRIRPVDNAVMVTFPGLKHPTPMRAGVLLLLTPDELASLGITEA